MPKNWCFQTMVLEKTLESSLDSKETKPVNPKGNQLGIFSGRSDAKAEAPILWPPDAKSWLIGKDPDAGKDCGQEKKGVTEHEMVGWHHQLNGHELSKPWEIVKDTEACLLQFTGLQRVGTRLSNWTTITICLFTRAKAVIGDVYDKEVEPWGPGSGAFKLTHLTWKLEKICIPSHRNVKLTHRTKALWTTQQLTDISFHKMAKWRDSTVTLRGFPVRREHFSL